MKFSFSNQAEVTTGTMVIMAIAGSKLGSRGIVLDKEMGMALSRAIKTSQFEGKVGQNLSVKLAGEKKITSVLVVGLGDPKDIDCRMIENVGGRIYGALLSGGDSTATICLDQFVSCSLKPEKFAAHVAFGAKLSSYIFEKYRTKNLPSTNRTRS